MRLIFENNHQPAIGRYKNAVVEDQANTRFWLYDSCGTYANFTPGEPGDIAFSQLFENDDHFFVQHDLGKFPSVTLIDEDNVPFIGGVHYVDDDRIEITLSEPMSGVVLLN